MEFSTEIRTTLLLLVWINLNDETKVRFFIGHMRKEKNRPFKKHCLGLEKKGITPMKINLFQRSSNGI